MKNKYLILVAALCLVGGLLVFYVSKPSSTEVNNPAPQNSLTVNSNDTATVTGMVDEHILGCTVDGTCYLKLIVEGDELRVVYNEGDVPQSCKGNAGTAQGLKKGDYLESFGSYSKFNNVSIINICGAAEYYIRKI